MEDPNEIEVRHYEIVKPLNKKSILQKLYLIMKKILSVTILTLSLSACSKEDNDCKCDAKYTIPGQSGYYTVPKTPINCETGQPLNANAQPNAFFVGCN